MIDEGAEPLAAVDAVYNGWHGYYRTGTGWRSRAGAIMPGFVAGSAATGKISAGRSDAYLVDFSRPTVETPAEEAALGLDRWNKAILHGEARAYAINAAAGFGLRGWPYRAADGAVWYLMAQTAVVAGSEVVQVRARRLRADFAEPTTVVASLSVPASAGVAVANFSPNGTHAAIHAYDADFHTSTWGNALLDWVVEADVSGGSATVAPSISLSITFDSSNVGAEYFDGAPPDVPIMRPQMSSSLEYETLSPTRRRVTATITATAVQASDDDGPQFRPLWSGSMVDRVLMVAYGPAGDRQVIRGGTGVFTQYDVPTLTVTAPGIEQYEEELTGGVWVAVDGTTVVIQPIAYYWEQRVYQSAQRWLRREADQVANIEAATERVVRGDTTALPGQTYQVVSGVTVSGPTNVGNGWSAGVSCIDNPSVPLRFSRPSGNVAALWVEDTNRKLLAYAGAVGEGVHAYSAPLTLSGSRMPAVHPVTGAFDPAVMLFF